MQPLNPPGAAAGGGSPPGLVLRPGTPADAADLAVFAARTFAHTYGAHNRPEDMQAHLAAHYGPRQQREELASPDVATVLAMMDGALAGFAQVRRHAPPACVQTARPLELHRFYVDAPWHGRGVAQRLMTAAMEAACRLGGGALWASVWDRNDRALAFYARCGFADVGRTWFCVGADRQEDRVVLALLEPAA